MASQRGPCNASPWELFFWGAASLESRTVIGMKPRGRETQRCQGGGRGGRRLEFADARLGSGLHCFHLAFAGLFQRGDSQRSPKQLSTRVPLTSRGRGVPGSFSPLENTSLMIHPTLIGFNRLCIRLGHK